MLDCPVKFLSLPEVLPVPDGSSVEPPYLIDATSGLPYPYPNPPGSPDGRQFNPLLESSPTNPVQDPWYDPAANPTPTTLYYALNSSSSLAILDRNVGFGNVHVFYNGVLPTDEQYVVQPPPTGTILWRNGEVTGISQGPGDDTVPQYSARPDDLWPGYQPHDLFVPDLPGQQRNEEHALLPVYPESQQAIGAVLTGDTTPPFSTPLNPLNEQLQRDDLQQLIVVGMSPIELMVEDPTGRRLGYDPATGQILSEIPLGFYDHPTGGLAYLVIYAPLTGDYTLTTTGTGAGDYTVVALFSDAQGTAQLFYETGVIQPDEIRTGVVSVPVESVAVPIPPEVSAVAGQPVAFVGQFSDINPNDTHEIVWDFGDRNSVSDALTPTHAMRSQAPTPSR